MDTFSKRHPLCILGYYMIALMCLFMAGHPLLFLITAVLMFICRLTQIGVRRSIRSFFYSMGAVVLCLVVNPLCNHRGVTALFTIGDMRITKEAIWYGGHMSLLLLASVFLFSCFSYYMTAEKIMSLMGKQFPSFAMLFTMILRVVPKVRKDFQEITAYHGNRPKVWSALFRNEMEEAIERSIAMKQKHYGEKKRSHYWKKQLTWQDWLLCVMMCGMFGYLIWYRLTETMTVRYFPGIYISSVPWWQWCLYLIYMGIPIWLRGKEECKWFLWRRRITNSIIRNKQSQPFLLQNGR